MALFIQMKKYSSIFLFLFFALMCKSQTWHTMGTGVTGGISAAP
jgi:hypothetical protein